MLAISLTSTTASRTVPAQMSFFVGPDPFNPPYAQLATASVIVTLPVIVIVLLFQRRDRRRPHLRRSEGVKLSWPPSR